MGATQLLKQIEGAIQNTGRDAGWRRERGEASLSDVFRTIKVGGGTSVRRFAAFLGPGYLVAVGYMDPGNWATSLAGGSKFGYTLLVVALISNIMAIVLQSLCARLAIASGRDLAQACRDAYPRWAAYPLWLAGRDRHHRHRHRRGDRHGHRPQPAVRHPARDRRDAHRARRVPDPLSAAARLSLSRGADHHAARRHRRLLCRPDRARQPGVGPADPRLRADHRDRAQSRDALSGHGHPRRHRDAAQPLPAFGHRADARLRRHARPRSARR